MRTVGLFESLNQTDVFRIVKRAKTDNWNDLHTVSKSKDTVRGRFIIHASVISMSLNPI